VAAIKTRRLYLSLPLVKGVRLKPQNITTRLNFTKSKVSKKRAPKIAGSPIKDDQIVHLNLEVIPDPELEFAGCS
jgi:hypothetical protein